MNGFVWLGRLGAHRAGHLFLAMTKSFCCQPNLFLINKIHTRTHDTREHTIMWCVWGQMIVLGMVQWPTLNSHWAATATVAGMTPRHHYQTKQLALRTGTVSLSLFFSFLFRFSPFFFAFIFSSQEKWKCLTGKIKYSRFSPRRTWFNLFCWLEN